MRLLTPLIGLTEFSAFGKKKKIHQNTVIYVYQGSTLCLSITIVPVFDDTQFF